MTSKKGEPRRSKRSSAKPSPEVSSIELSETAEKAVRGLSEKDSDLIIEALRLIKKDPFDPAHARKLRGSFEGYYRARKGDWRIIYLPPVEGSIFVVYTRKRDEGTYA